MFQGSMPALVTPFVKGELDEGAFAKFVEWQIDEGSHGLVPVGTTGESPTLSHGEHKRLVEICVETANKRVPVIAGAGSNNTAEAIDLTRHAEEVGADAVLIVTPYYNKPDQRGLYAHFKAISDATKLPIIIYNIPPRSIVDMSVATMARLFHECDNIAGVKDATGDLARVSLQRAAMGEAFIQLSGEDMTALGFNAQGGRGCISVTANIAPRLCAEFQTATLEGRFEDALTIQDRLAPLHEALFIQPNPSGPKYALSKLGILSEEVRLPMVGVSDDVKKIIDEALVHAGLLKLSLIHI